jgi:excisionase family DNA binding protein
MQSDANAARALLSIQDVMGTTGLSRTTVFKLLASGQLPSVSVGRRRLVRADQLASWLDSLGRRVGAT